MRFDLAVVGAGTAGAALALHAARAGLRVVALDRHPLEEAGARWVNGVARWMFREAGLAQPEGEELAGAGAPFHLVAGRGPTRVVVPEHDVLDVDMRYLVTRLQRGALDAGAELRGGVHVHGLEDGVLRTSAGPVEATWLADASGLAGARLAGSRTPPPGDVCAAAQEVRAIRDPAGARAFLEREGVGEGTTLCYSAVAGGYSIVNVRVEGDRVSLLTGSLPAYGHPSGARLLHAFVDEQRWIGPRLFGGSRSIPLGVVGRLARGRLATLGDAGRQVFSAHGSGVGLGLVAARMLAEALASGRGPRAYARDFLRAWGPLLVVYDAFRRLSQRLGPRQVAWMMRAGLIDARSSRAALEMRLPSLR